jgi:hypothetical protein
VAPQKKFGKRKKQGKVDFISKHGFEVFIWAAQISVRLVNAWQTLQTPFFLANKSLGMLCT